MDSSEYKTMSQFYPKMIACFGQSPNDIVDHLRPLRILAPGDLEFLNNPQYKNDQKARKIVDVVMIHILDDTQVFHKFVFALEAAGEWTKKIVSKLKESCPLLTESGKQN